MTMRTPPAWIATRDGAPGQVAIAVNRIECDGYGTCAELLPEMISLDEWGYPIIRSGPVPPALLDHARMAVDTCPVLALRLVAAGRATMSPAGSARRPAADAARGRHGRR